MTPQQIAALQTSLNAAYAAEPTIGRARQLSFWAALSFAVSQGDTAAALACVQTTGGSGFYNLQTYGALVALFQN